MSTIPEDLLYTHNHLWVRVLDEFVCVCGITDHFQDVMGDISFVELPEEEMELSQGEQFGFLESIRDVCNIHSPISGRIIKVNILLDENPGLINNDPYNEGWIVQIEIKYKYELDDLLNPDSYLEHIELNV
ncbi:MAG: glycine cleavage system protein GcvH [Spirochaetota bacterium]|nr:glycine cleavage system protein GcvH [Spirochaetota bacterium]